MDPMLEGASWLDEELAGSTLPMHGWPAPMPTLRRRQEHRSLRRT